MSKSERERDKMVMTITIIVLTTIITIITWTGGHGKDFEAGARKTDRDREPRAAQEHWVGRKMNMVMVVIMMMMSPRALGEAEVVSYPVPAR